MSNIPRALAREIEVDNDQAGIVGNSLRSLVLLLIATFLTACTGLGVEDVTDKPPYSKMVGCKYLLLEPVWMIGVTDDLKPTRELDYITMVPGVGFTGPEVIFRERIGKGTMIELERVLLNRSIFPSAVEYVVKVHGYDKHWGVDRILSLTGGNEGPGLELSIAIYEKITVSPKLQSRGQSKSIF